MILNLKLPAQIVLYALVIAADTGCAAPLTINQLQFVGSHNSYRRAMSTGDLEAVRARNPDAAAALDYNHVSLEEQLDLGLRKLELDVFYAPSGAPSCREPGACFPVGHVQLIDMNSHCPALRACLLQIRAWSDRHPRHVPIWISFNAKDQEIAGLPKPVPFSPEALLQMDSIIEEVLSGRLIRPADIVRLQWPKLRSARGKFVLILDEQGDKRKAYWQGWRERPMFTNSPVDHPAAAVMIINDPLAQQARIRTLVRAGYLVRTRADADTHEARIGSTERREAAFASGAQAVSTDYYLPADHFGTDYQVVLPGGVRCNPVTAPAPCTISEH